MGSSGINAPPSTSPHAAAAAASPSAQYTYTSNVSAVVGPFVSPRGVREVVDRLADALENSAPSSTPAEVASTFLQCMLVRAKSRPLGQKMVAQTLHSGCKTGGGGGGMQDAIRVFTTKQLQVLGADPNTIRSLVSGTTPAMQYEIPTTTTTTTTASMHSFEVARVTSGSSPSSSSSGLSFNSCARPDPNAQPTCDVHFVCSGVLPTHSPTRFVRLELEKDGSGWRVRDFADLMKPVLPPARWKSDADKAAAEAAEAAATTTTAVAVAASAEMDAYRKISLDRSTGGSGFNKPIFGGGLTRWKKKARETTAQRCLRQQVAKADTKGLARRLSAAELNRKFASNPQARVIVDMSTGDGMVRKRFLKKGELFDKSIGFTVELQTMADMEREAAAAKQAAEEKRAEQFNRRIRAAIASG